MLRLIKPFLNLGGMLCLSGVLVACGGGEDRQAKYLDRAQQYFDEGNYDKARIDLKNVLQINANNADARYVMALVEEKEGNWRVAFASLNAVVELDENHLEAITKLGTILLAGKRVEEATEKAERAMELAPDNANSLALMAYVELSRANADIAEQLAIQSLAIDPGQETAAAVLVAIYGKDQPEMALDIAEKALEANSGSLPLSMLQLGMLNALGRSDELIVAVEKLIKLHPDDNTYIFQLARYYNAALRTDDAEALLRESIKARPEETELKLFLVNLLSVNNDNETAIAELEVMLEADPENYQLRSGLGQSLFRADHIDRATAVYEAAFEYDHEGADSQAARDTLAAFARSQKDWAAARRWIDEALALEPENPGALINRAGVNIAEGNHELAVPDLRRALRSQPDSVQGLLLLAEAEKSGGKASLALENYRKVLAVDANNTIALFQASALLAAQEDYTDAAANLERLIKLQPESVQAIVALVEVYARLDRWDDAQAMVDSLAANEATQPVADLISSGLALRKGEYDEAIALAKSVLEKNDEMTGAAVNIARAYAGKGEVPEAIVYLEPYQASHPDNANVADILALLYLGNKEPEKAAGIYVKVIELVPARVSAYINLARIYAMQNKPELLEGLYLQGIAANPDNTALRVSLADVHQRQGQIEKALALLEEAYQQDNTSQVIINNLAIVLIDYYPTEENLKRVQTMTRGFESMKNPALLDTAGWLQYRLNNALQAISLLQAAQKNGGVGVDYWYHLGMAYHANGQSDLAKEQLGKALENPAAQFNGREEAQKVYDSLIARETAQ
jgi:tetratricopeptide (TPR) repeat protein